MAFRDGSCEIQTHVFPGHRFDVATMSQVPNPSHICDTNDATTPASPRA